MSVTADELDDDRLAEILNQIYGRMEDAERRNLDLEREVETLRVEVTQLKLYGQRTLGEELDGPKANASKINSANSRWSNLWEAIENNDPPGVRGFLYTSPPSVLDQYSRNSCDNTGDYCEYTPLELACSMGFVDVVAEILKFGPFRGKVPNRAIHVACENKHIEVVKLLLEAGVHVDYRDTGIFAAPCIIGYGGKTPLICAARWDAEDIIALLLEKGADPAIKLSNGTTALSMACDCGSAGAVRLLAAASGDIINAINKDGKTLLQEMVERRQNKRIHYNEYEEEIRALLENGADPSIANNNRPTPVDLAFRDYDGFDRNGGDEALAKMIIEHCKDVNMKTRNGDFLLEIAIRRQKTELVRLLLERGADPNLGQNNCGPTILEEAELCCGNSEILKLLGITKPHETHRN